MKKCGYLAVIAIGVFALWHREKQKKENQIDELIKQGRKNRTDEFLLYFERYEEKWTEFNEKCSYMVIKPCDAAKSLVSIEKHGKDVTRKEIAGEDLDNFMDFVREVWEYGLCEPKENRTANGGVLRFTNGLELTVPSSVMYCGTCDM